MFVVGSLSPEFSDNMSEQSFQTTSGRLWQTGLFQLRPEKFEVAKVTSTWSMFDEKELSPELKKKEQHKRVEKDRENKRT